MGFTWYNLTELFHLVIVAAGWWVSARHLWAIDYILILFALVFATIITIKRFERMEEEGEENMRILAITLISGHQILFRSFFNCNFANTCYI
jgi:hypothetical protein